VYRECTAKTDSHFDILSIGSCANLILLLLLKSLKRAIRERTMRVTIRQSAETKAEFGYEETR
jgi:hypothetical protein